MSGICSSLETTEKLLCYHCGDPCRDIPIHVYDKDFCCEGCKLVYEILKENNLSNYYSLNANPGDKSIKTRNAARYEFLDDEQVLQKLVSFTDGTETHITFLIPQIHCSSCIWLLEHLYKLDMGVKRSTVNFLKREASIVFNEKETSLRKVAELLNRIGYPPHISLSNLEKKKAPATNMQTYYKLGVAFFCFGNIMLLSFPEYFGLSSVFEGRFVKTFGYLNILLSLPVLLYADIDFFRSAWNGLKQGRLNMDFPISLGITVMYSRSLYEILSGTGAGYMDTFAGLIFFMLTGRMFQNKTYERLSFERDYKSYFPVAVSVLKNGKEESKAVSDLHHGDRILVRNGELIPADCILLKGDAAIDYSFVTGENIPVPKQSGDRIYAGGRQAGSAIELEVVSEVSQSRLTQLWNEHGDSEHKENELTSIVDKVSYVFTLVVIAIAAAAGGWWIWKGEVHTALNAFTAVLIITCPCALALSYPFTLGNSIRILGNQNIYLKNTRVIEKMASIDTIVFDKTGTLTKAGDAEYTWHGSPLNTTEILAVASLASSSQHPLSRVIAGIAEESTRPEVSNFEEIPGKGMSGIVIGMMIKAGSTTFAGNGNSTGNSRRSEVHVTINSTYKGFYEIRGVYREGLKTVTNALSENYNLHLLSGDNDAEKESLAEFFPDSDKLHFGQSPANKLQFIKNLQHQGNHVLMAGDGLNDAGALFQSNVGLAVSDDTNNFSPACDAILDAKSFHLLPMFLKFSKYSMNIIYVSYLISLLYNCIGIWFAVQGLISPLFAAIIMPLSTISMVLFTTTATNLIGKLVFRDVPGQAQIKADKSHQLS
ncbi:MAG TPA: heavy metal translocating P-type ATPase metal-binding domain-containing protein [Bacteroidia bacterium]|nr:heavy metal translocating P-type ATPase metal-binding domain-containing protein [Bacteroidia bacterium]